MSEDRYAAYIYDATIELNEKEFRSSQNNLI